MGQRKGGTEVCAGERVWGAVGEVQGTWHSCNGTDDGSEEVRSIKIVHNTESY